MQRAVIAYRNGRLEAREQDDVWTVRLADLEVRAGYLDLALAELLGNAPEAHRAAARLLTKLANVVEQQEKTHSRGARAARRVQPSTRRRAVRAKPLVLGLRLIALAAVTTAAFMLTTWLTVLR
jgi:hypothetical protein